MTPFSAFALFITAALTHQHLTQPEQGGSSNTAEAASIPSPAAATKVDLDRANRGASYDPKEVLQFKNASVCQDASVADPKLCGNFPKLTALPNQENEWLELAQKAIMSFSLGFGQTEFAAKSGSAPVNLNTTQFFPEVLRAGLNPSGYANIQKEFNTQKATQTVSYDLRICSLGGRLRTSVVDANPIDKLNTSDSFTIAESACEELNFRTDPSILSSVFTAIQSAENKQFELSSQGQVARVIGNTRYAGSVANLKQKLDMQGNNTVIDYLDGALGYCIGANQGAVAWDQQCLKTGVVMDGLRVKKVIQADSTAQFPGTSYIALSLADGLDTTQKPRQLMYEMVGKDLAFAPKAFAPTDGTMTVVGHQGEKIRIHFKGEQIRIARLNGQGEALAEKTIQATQIQSRAGFVR
ncbi:MAG TPA: hypothetical protein VFV43_01790 [Limnobacter sp.]|nr:hypothetical protein [Limnobacter sp.]